MHVTVYAKANCPQCTQTRREMDRLGIAYEVVDLERDLAQHNRLIAAGYRTAPVVESDTGAWSGYQPECIRGLAADKQALG